MGKHSINKQTVMPLGNGTHCDRQGRNIIPSRHGHTEVLRMFIKVRIEYMLLPFY